MQDARDQNQWGNNSFQLFAQVADHADIDKLNARIKNVKQDKVSEEEKRFKAEIFLHPMTQWHLNQTGKMELRTGGFIQYVWLFGIVGIFVLLLACINFMNLSTARSEKRAREVGIRKAVGSARGQMIRQFFGESLLVVVLAFVVCHSDNSYLLLPWFNQVTSKKILFPLDEPVFWIMSLAFIFITGLLAGSYPAFYLSSFQSGKSFKRNIPCGTVCFGTTKNIGRRAVYCFRFIDHRNYSRIPANSAYKEPAIGL